MNQTMVNEQIMLRDTPQGLVVKTRIRAGHKMKDDM